MKKKRKSPFVPFYFLESRIEILKQRKTKNALLEYADEDGIRTVTMMTVESNNCCWVFLCAWHHFR